MSALGVKCLAILRGQKMGLHVESHHRRLQEGDAHGFRIRISLTTESGFIGGVPPRLQEHYGGGSRKDAYLSRGEVMKTATFWIGLRHSALDSQEYHTTPPRRPIGSYWLLGAA